MAPRERTPPDISLTEILEGQAEAFVERREEEARREHPLPANWTPADFPEPSLTFEEVAAAHAAIDEESRDGVNNCVPHSIFDVEDATRRGTHNSLSRTRTVTDGFDITSQEMRVLEFYYCGCGTNLQYMTAVDEETGLPKLKRTS